MSLVASSDAMNIMTRRKAPPISEAVFAEDRALSVSRLTDRSRNTLEHETLSPSTSEGDSPNTFKHFPTHRKNVASVDFSVLGTTLQRHKRSASELTTPKSKGKGVHLPLPQLQEESSSGMSDSEKTIRRIIHDRQRKDDLAQQVPPANTELATAFSRVRHDIEGEFSARERRKRMLKHSVLRLVTDPFRGDRLDTWTSDEELSPEPSAQPLPMFQRRRVENKADIAAALTLILSKKKQLRFELTLLQSTSGSPFSLLLLSSDLKSLLGLFCFQGRRALKLWGAGPEEITQQEVECCYRLVRGRPFLLPHNRLSPAVDAVTLIALS